MTNKTILNEGLDFHDLEGQMIPTVTVDETGFILDFLQNCDKNMYIEVRDYHAKLKDSAQIKPQKIKCIHCQHEYEQSIVINATDFFG
jgi:hypothetical protein